MARILDLNDYSARMPIAYGRHAVKGLRRMHRDDTVGTQVQRVVQQLLGEGPWDGVESLYVEGFPIAGADYAFHTGDGSDAPDAFFPDDDAHPWASYWAGRLKAGLSEAQWENVFGIFRTLRTPNFDGAGVQLQENGAPIPGGADPRDYYYYGDNGANPMRVVASEILRFGRRPGTVINWPAWVDLRDWNDELIDWDDSLYTPRSLSVTPTTGGSLASGTYYVSVAAEKDGDESGASTHSVETLAETVVVAGGDSAFQVSWLVKEGATPTGFRIYIGTVPGVWLGYKHVASGAAVSDTITTVAGLTAGAPLEEATSGLLRQIKRFESHLFFVPPYSLASSVDRIMQISCADYQWSGLGTGTYRNDMLRFLSPATREPVIEINAAEIAPGSLKIFPTDRRSRPNQVIVNYRDLDDEFLDEAEPVVLDREAMQEEDGQVKTFTIEGGCMYRSQAQRVASYWARMLCDMDLGASLKASPKLYPVLPVDRVTITHTRPDWEGIKFRVSTKDEAPEGELGDDMSLHLHADDLYSDTDHWPVARPIPPAKLDPFAPPPEVTSLALTENNILQADQTVVSVIRVAVECAAFTSAQRVRVSYKLASEGDEDYKEAGTLLPDPVTLSGVLEIRGVEKAEYDVKVVPESGFASGPATVDSITITGKLVAPAAPATLTATYEPISGKIRITFPASTDGDIQYYELYTTTSGVDTLFTKVGNALEAQYTPLANWSAAINFKVKARNWSNVLSTTGATTSISPPALSSVFGVQFSQSGTLRHYIITNSALTAAEKARIAGYEVGVGSALGTGLPTLTIYRGSSLFFDFDIAQLSSKAAVRDVHQVRAYDRFGNFGDWTGDISYASVEAGGGEPSPETSTTIEIDETLSNESVVTVRVLNSDDKPEDIAWTHMQVRAPGDSWPSGDARMRLRGLHLEVVVPKLAGESDVEIRAGIETVKGDIFYTPLVEHTFVEPTITAADALAYKGNSAPSGTEFSYLAGVTSAIQTQLNAKAPNASPTFTGLPAAPTPVTSDISTRIATTAFVNARITSLINAAPGALDTLGEIAAQLASDESAVTALTTAVAGKQPLDATLTSLSGLGTAADRIAYTTGVDTWAETTLSSFGRSLIDDTSATAARATLGVIIGTDVQAYDATLAALAAYNTNGFLVQTAPDTFAGRTITGTNNQVTVTNGSGVSGNPTLSLPQDIHTGASPTFASLNVAQINNSANLTIAPTGDLILNPTSNQVDPAANYDINLGQLSKKYLTIHAAESYIETIVAQSTMATMGGRLLIPVSADILIANVATGDTTINVKYGGYSAGDILYFESAGKVEFMSVTSGSVIPGGFQFVVTRNLDGSGANQWYAGDSLINTGAVGSGFIDIYSVQGVKGSSQPGPAIAGNVRKSTVYNDWGEVFAIGNLKGLYGYGVTAYGVAFGEYAASKTHLTIDSTNGYRIFNGTSTVIGQWDASGNITVGEVAAAKSNVYISAGALSLRNNTTERIGLTAAGVLTIKDSAGNAVITLDASVGAEITKKLAMTGASSAIAIGTTPPTSASAGTGIWLDRTGMYGLSAGTVQAKFDAATGAVFAGGGNVTLNSNGISVAGSSTKNVVNSYKFVDSGGSTLSLLYEAYGEFSHGVTLEAQDAGGRSSYVGMLSTSGSDVTSQIQIKTIRTSVGTEEILLSGGAGINIMPSTGVTVGSTTAPAAMLDVYKEDAVTSAMTDVQILRHNTSGTGAAGFGGSVLFRLESSTTADQDAARIGAIWTTATHASRTSAVVIQTVNSAGALTEAARFAGNGNFTFAGIIPQSVQVANAATQSFSVGMAGPATVNTIYQLFVGTCAFSGQAGAGGEGDFGINWYYNSGFKYRTTDYAARVAFNSTSNGNVSFETAPSGTAGNAITFTARLGIANDGGITIGSPTGGSKGAGTLNMAADIYKNNAAYTNPDYVLEHWATGRIEKFADKEGASDYFGLQSLATVKEFIRKHYHLPRFGQEARHGLFSGGESLLASLEEAYLYIFQLETRISQLEESR